MRGLIPKRENKAFTPPRLRVPRSGRIERSADKRRSRWMRRALSLSIVVAVAACLSFQEGIWPSGLLNQTMSTALQTVRRKLERKQIAAPTPYIVVENPKTSINQPLPLGIALINSVSEETVVLSGLIEGTSLSLGTPLTATRWSLPGRDLDKAFISAPENFKGVMEVVVTLYSSRQEILETKQARFEWYGSGKADKLPIAIAPDRRPSR